MDGLGDAVARFNDHDVDDMPPPKEEEMTEGSGDGGGKGHTFHVHKHKDGKHHLTVHGEGGQMVHHSEHDSLEEAAEEMKKHGEEA